MNGVAGSARAAAFAAGVVVAAAILASCGGSSHPSGAGPAAAASKAAPTTIPKLTPSELLQRSRLVVDRTPAVHFQLSSAGVAPNATALLGGSGDLVRPDELRGSLLVAESGLSATVKVISVGGAFYVQLPFASKYSRTNPAAYGLGDPAQLLSPTRGVSSLLSAMRAPTSKGSIRLGGELLDVVAGTVPGAKVPVLPDLARAEPVTVTADIAPGSYQLRRVQLAGPFTKATTTTTYDVTITGYGERVTVRAPTTH